ncbi:MAG: M24 family metallopeptidase [Thermoplasmata archaeon]
MAYHYEKRWAKIKDHLEQKGYDAFISKISGNLRYLCCAHIPSSPIVSYVIVPRKDEPCAIASSLEEFRAKEESAIENIKIFSPYPDIPKDGRKGIDVVKNVLREKNIKSVLIDSEEKLTNVKVKVDDFITKMRERKDNDEVNAIKKACNIADYGAKILVDEILEEGISESSVANELDYALREKGAQCMSFPTIIGSGKHSIFPHHDVGGKKIKAGEPIICDFGVYVDGYCSDITRTYFLGKVSKKLVEMYDLVLEAQEKTIRYTKINKTLKSIDGVSRALFHKSGYGRYFVHGTGHGIGLDVHESPNVTFTAKGKIEKGNVVTVEPGLYIPGVGGIRIEDDILVDNKISLLTHAKKPQY